MTKTMIHEQTNGPLSNYLRAHRRKTGLTQHDLARVLGYVNRDAISRHERLESMPSLLLALSYEVLYRVPVSEIFAGLKRSLRNSRLTWARKALEALGRFRLRANWNGLVSGEVRDIRNLTLMSTRQPNRILAVEIRSARLGYAVFETPRYLRDFGAAWFDSPAIARSRIARFLHFYRPSVLVLRGGNARYPRNMRMRRAAGRIARDEARKLAIPNVRVSEVEFSSVFEQYSCRDKYDVATVLVGWFPDLAWRLPPRPKFYDPEPRSMLYFDSIALGIAYLDLQAKPNGSTSTAME
jgi:DNA-binding XRE family transcriptional regulator